MCEDLNVPFLGNIPLDPLLARYCDEGKDLLSDMPDNPAIKAVQKIVKSKININVLFKNCLTTIYFQNCWIPTWNNNRSPYLLVNNNFK